MGRPLNPGIDQSNQEKTHAFSGSTNEGHHRYDRLRFWFCLRLVSNELGLISDGHWAQELRRPREPFVLLRFLLLRRPRDGMTRGNGLHSVSHFSFLRCSYFGIFSVQSTRGFIDTRLHRRAASLTCSFIDARFNRRVLLWRVRETMKRRWWWRRRSGGQLRSFVLSPLLVAVVAVAAAAAA